MNQRGQADGCVYRIYFHDFTSLSPLSCVSIRLYSNKRSRIRREYSIIQLYGTGQTRSWLNKINCKMMRRSMTKTWTKTERTNKMYPPL